MYVTIILCFNMYFYHMRLEIYKQQKPLFTYITTLECSMLHARNSV